MSDGSSDIRVQVGGSIYQRPTRSPHQPVITLSNPIWKTANRRYVPEQIERKMGISSTTGRIISALGAIRGYHHRTDPVELRRTMSPYRPSNYQYGC